MSPSHFVLAVIATITLLAGLGCWSTPAAEADESEKEQTQQKEESVEPLAKHAWKHRPVVVFAPGDDDEQFAEQMSLLKAHEEGVAERDIVLYRVIAGKKGEGPEGKLTEEEAEALYGRFAPGEAFTVILVGKDTGEKLRREEVLEMEELFGTIDAMPMRQREMGR